MNPSLGCEGANKVRSNIIYQRLIIEDVRIHTKVKSIRRWLQSKLVWAVCFENINHSWALNNVRRFLCILKLSVLVNLSFSDCFPNSIQTVYVSCISLHISFTIFVHIMKTSFIVIHLLALLAYNVMLSLIIVYCNL